MLTEFDEEILTRHAERAMLHIFCREAINPCLKKLGKPAMLEVYNTKKSKAETILAQSINKNTIWEKFYVEKGSELDRGSLDNIQEKALRYANFLIYTHKQKYQFIKHDNELEWLHIVTIVSAVMKSAESRYQENRFKDQEARQRLAVLLLRREENVSLAEGWGHAKKHDEDAKEVLNKVFDAYQNRINDAFFPPYKEELPPLPPGMLHPLAWLTERLGLREIA